MVGEYALALAIAGPVVTFLNMKLRAVQASDAKDEFSFADYFGLRILTSVLATLIITLIALRGDREPEVRFTIIILAIAKAFESTSDILFGLQQKNERMDLVSRSIIIKGILSMSAFALGFWLTGKVAGGTSGLALAWLITLLAIDFPNANKTLRASYRKNDSEQLKVFYALIPRPRFSRQVLWSLTLLTLPLAFTVTLGSLSNNIPRYFVDHWWGRSELGVYAAMIYPLAASSLMISALAQSATPQLSSSFQNHDYGAFRSLLAKLVLLAAIIGGSGIVVVMAAGKQIITILYGKDYAQYTSIFLWVMVNAALGYLYVFLGTALNAMRHFRVQLPIHVISVALLLGMCWLLVPAHGLKGALIALTVTAITEATMYVVIVYRGIYRATQTNSRFSKYSNSALSSTEGAVE